MILARPLWQIVAPSTFAAVTLTTFVYALMKLREPELRSAKVACTVSPVPAADWRPPVCVCGTTPNFAVLVADVAATPTLLTRLDASQLTTRGSSAP